MTLKQKNKKSKGFFNNKSNLKQRDKNIHVEVEKVHVQSAEDYVLCGSNR